MELLQLKYFLQVAELESISQAAEVLYISQPALSKTIVKLEKELGTPLFDRIGNRIHLNERGQLFLKSVKASLRELNDGLSALSDLSSRHMPKLSLGVFASHSLIIDCIRQFVRAHPQVQFEINCRTEALEQSGAMSFDIIFFPANKDFERYRGIPVTREETGLVVSKDHRLAYLKKVDLHLFKHDYFVFMNNTQQIYDQSYNLCLQSGFKPLVRFSTNSAISHKELISYGLAVGFSPEGKRKEYTHGSNLAYLEIKQDVVEQTILVGCKRDIHLSETAKTFRDFLLHHFGIPIQSDTLEQMENRSRQ